MDDNKKAVEENKEPLKDIVENKLSDEVEKPANPNQLTDADLGQGDDESLVPVVEPIFGHAQATKKRKLLLSLIVIVLVIAAGLVAWYVLGVDNKKAEPSNTASQQSANQPTVGATISVTAATVNPTTVKIKKGQAIVWKNDDTKDHQIAADPYPTNTSLPELGKGEVLKPGDSVSFVFEKSGTFTYHDNLDPFVIKGVVIVE